MYPHHYPDSTGRPPETEEKKGLSKKQWILLALFLAAFPVVWFGEIVLDLLSYF